MLALAVVSVIPWIPATPPAPPVPPLAPACRTSQLHVSGAGRSRGLFVNGAGGQLVGSVTLRNEGAPCSLSGRLQLRFVGGPSAAVPQHQSALASSAPTPDQLLPPFSTRALPHGAAVSTTFWWRNWCAPGNAGGGKLSAPPTAAEVRIPTGSTVRFKVATAPRCDQPGGASTVSVGPLQPVAPQPKAATHLPVTLALDQEQYRAAAGSVLHFQVTMTNAGKRVLAFHGCPLYFEGLAPTSSHEIHILNCKPMGALSPGAHAVFAMEERIPQLRPGSYGLQWQVGLGTYLPPSVGAGLTVTG